MNYNNIFRHNIQITMCINIFIEVQLCSFADTIFPQVLGGYKFSKTGIDEKGWC